MIQEYDIELEDLPRDFRDIVEALGMETAMILVELCGGRSTYIPKLEKIAQPARYRMIYDEFKLSRSPKVYAELAKKYNYSESHIRVIIRQEQLRRHPKPEQCELF